MRARGYILAETIVAMAVLSICIVAIHNALGQAMVAHAQARDLTQAHFLLQGKMGEFTLKPALEEGEESGDFGAAAPRFHWRATVSKVELPTPPTPSPDLQSLPAGGVPKLPVAYLAKVVITVQWTLSGQPFEERLETLLAPSHLPESQRNAGPAST